MPERFVGRVVIVDAQGREVFQFDDVFAVLDLGAQGNEGDLRLRGDDGQTKIHLDGGRSLVLVYNQAGTETIRMEGATGDIVLGNADVAEDFEVAPDDDPQPGSVMVVRADGNVSRCSIAYDPKVVGIVAGAGRYRPGIVLDRHQTPGRRCVPIAMMGKVACLADARYGAIGTGDLLTTSPTRGCAMRAGDPSSAVGAIIGKALTPLTAGEGLVDVLVGLR